MAELQAGVIGVEIIVILRDQDGVLIDLSTSTSRFIYLTRPFNKGTKQFSGTLVAGGSTGTMKYTTTSANDVDVPGSWTIQAVYLNSSGTFKSKRGTMEVLPNAY